MSPHGAKVVNTPARGIACRKGRHQAAATSSSRSIASVIDNSADVDAYLAGKQPGTELRLQVLARGRERRVTATLGRASGSAASGRRQQRRALPDARHGRAHGGRQRHRLHPGRQPARHRLRGQAGARLGLESGKTVRIIRGNVGPATEGQIYGMALSPNGRWLATGGWMRVAGRARPHGAPVRFLHGQARQAAQGPRQHRQHLAFSPDSRRLISGRQRQRGHHLGPRQPAPAASPGRSHRHHPRGRLHAGRRSAP